MKILLVYYKFSTELKNDSFVVEPQSVLATEELYLETTAKLFRLVKT